MEGLSEKLFYFIFKKSLSKTTKSALCVHVFESIAGFRSVFLRSRVYPEELSRNQQRLRRSRRAQKGAEKNDCGKMRLLLSRAAITSKSLATPGVVFLHQRGERICVFVTADGRVSTRGSVCWNSAGRSSSHTVTSFGGLRALAAEREP